MESKNPIQVADRLFLAMETLSKIGPVSLADLSRELNLNKSTTHRLLSSLIYMGYAKQDSETQKYDLSLKVLALSNCPQQLPQPLEASPSRAGKCKSSLRSNTG